MVAPSRKRRRLLIGALVIVIALLVVGAVGYGALRIYEQAMGVRDNLNAGMSDVKTVQKAVLAGDTDAATAAASQLSSHAAAAVAGTQGQLWQLAEAVPWVGNNLAAVRSVAETTDQLTNDVVTPASTISLDAIRPMGGRIDLEALANISGTFSQISDGITTASRRMESIERNGLIPEVVQGVEALSTALGEVQPQIAPIRDVLSVLPAALGAEGPRKYLVMFQGTSEARSLGGNAAVFMTIVAEGGALTVGELVQSADFIQARPEPVIPLDPQAVAIYGDKIGRWTPDFTMVPDFPSAVEIIDGWWSEKYSSGFNATMSIDPVALSYLLQATGPVTLANGESLTAENATNFLLRDVYSRYEDPRMQNAFFASTAESVFAKITTGDFAPLAMLGALGRSADEGRLLLYSTDPAQSELIAGSRMTGRMPADSAEQATVGIYINDNTGSKKSYYLDMAISACQGENSVSGVVTLSSALTADEAASLPYHVTGPYYAQTDISTYVVIYGPTGSTSSDITIDGGPATILSQGEHLGRPVFKVELLHHLEATHQLSFSFIGVPRAERLDVWNTPMVRDTNLSLESTCK